MPNKCSGLLATFWGDEFWLSVAQEYSALSAAAMDILTPFGSTYMCEKTFSSLAYLKNRQAHSSH